MVDMVSMLGYRACAPDLMGHKLYSHGVYPFGSNPQEINKQLCRVIVAKFCQLIDTHLSLVAQEKY